MKRRDFLNSSLLAAAGSIPGIRSAYAVVAPPVPDIAASPAMVARSPCVARRSVIFPRR